MTGGQEKKRTAATVVAVAALAVVAYSAARRRAVAEDVPADAAGWHGAMELYRNIALWAGKRAMLAEMNYWKAVE